MTNLSVPPEPQGHVYTPNTEYVRDFYAKFQASLDIHPGSHGQQHDAAEAEFDRWLSDVKAEALRGAARKVRLMAAERFEDSRLDDPSGAAIWDVAAWLDEEAAK